MTADARSGADRYTALLSEYLAHRSEAELYEASLLSEELARTGLGPDEIVALHMDTLGALTGSEGGRPMQRFRLIETAQQFLLEVMIAYGVHYKQHMDAILEERHRAEVESARVERERSQLLAAIAHEFGTPLTVATGHTARAVRMARNGRTAEAAEEMHEVAGALDRLGRLLANLQHASRAGALPGIDPTACEVGEIIAEACAWVRGDAEQKGVAVQVENRLTSPVLADPEALRTVVGNLLSNAIRYTSGGGGGWVVVRTGRADDLAWVEVHDNGIGMSEETRSRLFEPFFRAPEARTGAPQGLGLGLAITRQFVDALGGWLEVDSTPGAGSRFRVYLPLAEGVEGDREQPRRAQEAEGRKP